VLGKRKGFSGIVWLCGQRGVWAWCAWDSRMMSVNWSFGTRESMDDYMHAEGLGRASGVASAFRHTFVQ